jgi:S-adenosylmethionine/arginine decarboxylase-like enzyme
MFHFMLDAINGYRSRLDDILLVHEFLAEIPLKLGLKTIMPPFVLPYYNGIVPEDCGISSFVFLAGGHITLHTFSFREAYFIDILSPRLIDAALLTQLIKSAFPSEKVSHNYVERDKKESFPEKVEIDETSDFGPHLLLDFKDYEGPMTLDELFGLFDVMPNKIGMTPIMRPYALKNIVENQNVLSILTMIAESHIALHVFKESRRAYLDLFSCSFFNYKEVCKELRSELNGNVMREVIIPRGGKYKVLRNEPSLEIAKSRDWLQNVYSKGTHAR